MEEERLQKYLANNGVGSRRKCEQYILDGRVMVNGIIIRELGTKINPDEDQVYFDGKKVENKRRFFHCLVISISIKKS